MDLGSPCWLHHRTHRAGIADADQKRQLAPLVPVRRFVAYIDFAGGYQLSPDGAWLLDALTAAHEGYPDL